MFSVRKLNGKNSYGIDRVLQLYISIFDRSSRASNAHRRSYDVLDKRDCKMSARGASSFRISVTKGSKFEGRKERSCLNFIRDVSANRDVDRGSRLRSKIGAVRRDKRRRR